MVSGKGGRGKKKPFYILKWDDNVIRLSDLIAINLSGLF